jgi:hypothetical protein
MREPVAEDLLDGAGAQRSDPDPLDPVSVEGVLDAEDCSGSPSRRVHSNRTFGL